jgi:large subunit ribosomal protein L10
MNKTQKTAQIDSTRARFDGAVAAVLINFQGTNVQTVTALRRAFKKAGVDYRVVKNTIIRHALKDGAFKGFVGDLETQAKGNPHPSMRGMTGVAWCREDPSAAAKVLVKFKSDLGAKAEKLTVKAGLLGGQVKDALWVEKEMSALPGLKETQAMVLATVCAPAQNVVATLNAPAQNLVYLLANWIDARTAQEAPGDGASAAP